MTAIRDEEEFAPLRVWRRDDVVEVDSWPRTLRVVADFGILDEQFVRRVGDLVLFTVANGNATYRIAVEDRIRGELDCVLEDSELTPRGPF